MGCVGCQRLQRVVKAPREWQPPPPPCPQDPQGLALHPGVCMVPQGDRSRPHGDDSKMHGKMSVLQVHCIWCLQLVYQSDCLSVVHCRRNCHLLKAMHSPFALHVMSCHDMS